MTWPPWIATRAASSASSKRSLRAWTVSLNRMRSNATRVTCRTATVGQAPLDQCRVPASASGSSDASTSASASVAVRGCVRVSSAVPDGAGSAVASRTDPFNACSAKRPRRPASSASTWARRTVFRASSGTPKRAIARSTNCLASAGDPSSVRTFCHSGAISCGLMAFCANRARDFFSFSSASRQLASIARVPRRAEDRWLSCWCVPRRSIIDVHQRARDRTALVGQRDGHASRFRGCLGLAQDDIEHRAVDRAVGREEQIDRTSPPADRSGRRGLRAAGGGSGSRTRS